MDAIREESISSENVTEAILTHIRDDCQMFGGDILTITELLEPLARKRGRELNQTDSPGDFTLNMFHIGSIVIGCELGWKEIHNEKSRNLAASKVTLSVDKVGFMFFTISEQQSTTGCDVSPIRIIHPHLTVQLSSTPREHMEDRKCFEFPEASICIPRSAHSEDNHEDCLRHVASFWTFDISLPPQPHWRPRLHCQAGSGV